MTCSVPTGFSIHEFEGKLVWSLTQSWWSTIITNVRKMSWLQGLQWQNRHIWENTLKKNNHSLRTELPLCSLQNNVLPVFEILTTLWLYNGKSSIHLPGFDDVYINRASVYFTKKCIPQSRWNYHKVSRERSNALASHQCVPGSISRLGVICGLSLSLLWEVFARVLRFSAVFTNLHLIKFDLINLICTRPHKLWALKPIVFK